MKAKALIEDPAKWTYGAHFKDQRMCAEGAIAVVYEREADPHSVVRTPAFKFLNAAAQEIFGEGRGPCFVNDVCGHGAVMRMYDHAIVLSMEATAQERKQ